jgi:hypothetical protein
MCARSVSRFSVVAVCGVIVAAGLFSRISAQTQGRPEHYNATAINMGSGPAVAGRVLIAVDKWSTAIEREALLKVFAEKGPDKLLDALQDSPKVGYIRLPQTLAWDLRYAFESPLPEGGRRVVLATDRPIGFQEARDQPRRIDYPFTLIEIRFDKNGVGVGKMSVYTKISLSKDKKTMELENYGIEPVRLTEVRVEK